MKVRKEVKEIKQKENILQCSCGKYYEFEEDDIKNSDYGFPYVQCPCCGDAISINERFSKKINYNNLLFPDDFFSFSGGEAIDDITINKWIKKCIDNLEKQKSDSGTYSTACGDTDVSVFKLEDCYEIIVAKGYYKYRLTRGEE